MILMIFPTKPSSHVTLGLSSIYSGGLSLFLVTWKSSRWWEADSYLVPEHWIPKLSRFSRSTVAMRKEWLSWSMVDLDRILRFLTIQKFYPSDELADGLNITNEIVVDTTLIDSSTVETKVTTFKLLVGIQINHRHRATFSVQFERVLLWVNLTKCVICFDETERQSPTITVTWRLSKTVKDCQWQMLRVDYATSWHLHFLSRTRFDAYGSQLWLALEDAGMRCSRSKESRWNNIYPVVKCINHIVQ